MIKVALRKESVDRNVTLSALAPEQNVALRKESVDRNVHVSVECVEVSKVALRKESVDRNAGGFPTIKAMRGSLSARRAWIEITQSVKGFGSLP